MSNQASPELLRDVVVLQGKLWLEALRDIALSPVLLVLGLAALAFRGRAEQVFYGALKLSSRSDYFLDVFSAGRRHAPTPIDHPTLDQVLLTLEGRLRKGGAGLDFDTLQQHVDSIAQQSRSRIDHWAKDRRRLAVHAPREGVVEVRPPDGSLVRELLHPRHHGRGAMSLALALVEPGAATRMHRHHRSEELYHLLAGEAQVFLDGQWQTFEPGQTVRIPPGCAHALQNVGPVPLEVLCCCAPPYQDEDTELLPTTS